MNVVLTPKTLARNKGRMFNTISEETSMRKLVADTAQMLRGSALIEVLCSLSFIVNF